MALLIQFLVAFGVAAGRRRTGRSRPAATTQTSSSCWSAPRARAAKARPGITSRQRSPTSIPASTAAGWSSGLSSGEGLIAQVRDPIDPERHRRPHRQTPARRRSRVRTGDEGPRARRQHALAGRPQRLGRQTAADDQPQPPLRPPTRTSGSSATSPRTSCCATSPRPSWPTGSSTASCVIAVQRSKLLPFGGQLAGQRPRPRPRSARRRAAPHDPSPQSRSPTPRARTLDRRLPRAVGRARRDARRGDRPRRSARRTPGADLRPARRQRPDRASSISTPRSQSGPTPRPAAPGSSATAWRPHRRRHLDAGQRPAGRDQPHRGPRPVQPQQESPRDPPALTRARDRRPPPAPSPDRRARLTCRGRIAARRLAVDKRAGQREWMAHDRPRPHSDERRAARHRSLRRARVRRVL